MSLPALLTLTLDALPAGSNGRPKKVVVDIDGDGSFLMNCQELATAAVEGLDTKVFILNNQHLGMVVQWEDRFYKANRAHTYLGRRDGAPLNKQYVTLSSSLWCSARIGVSVYALLCRTTARLSM
jgi:TPP-dependent trihydroxycyclohexane-1,2-dione (THcHDO) dehydratase